MVTQHNDLRSVRFAILHYNDILYVCYVTQNIQVIWKL